MEETAESSSAQSSVARLAVGYTGGLRIVSWLIAIKSLLKSFHKSSVNSLVN